MFPGVVYYMLDFIMPVMTDACWKGCVIYTNCYHRNLNLNNHWKAMSCVSLTSCAFYRDPAAATSETQIMSFHFRRIINLKNCSCIHITSVFFQQGSFLCTINLISHQHLNSAKKMEVKWLWSEVLLLGPCTDKETEHKAQTDNKKKMRKEGNQRQQRIFFYSLNVVTEVWRVQMKTKRCRSLSGKKMERDSRSLCVWARETHDSTEVKKMRQQSNPSRGGGCWVIDRWISLMQQNQLWLINPHDKPHVHMLTRHTANTALQLSYMCTNINSGTHFLSLCFLDLSSSVNMYEKGLYNLSTCVLPRPGSVEGKKASSGSSKHQ